MARLCSEAGSNLPFGSETMDFVHTNQLLHFLQDPSAASTPYKQRVIRLFREISRVLAPGGQLVMKERLPDADPKWEASEIRARSEQLAELLTGVLRRSGYFGVVIVEQGWRPMSADFLFDPERNFAQYPARTNGLAINLYAQKFPHSTYYLPASAV